MKKDFEISREKAAKLELAQNTRTVRSKVF